jgi:hypothetical protein
MPSHSEWQKIGSSSAKKGNQTQADALPKLAQYFALVERIESAFRIIRGQGGRILNAIPVAKVSGDFRAVIPPSGRSVLIECKWRSDKLLFSDLEKHQHEALSNHTACGGLSLILWVNDRGFFLFDPLQFPDFRPKKSLTLSDLPDYDSRFFVDHIAMSGWL